MEIQLFEDRFGVMLYDDARKMGGNFASYGMSCYVMSRTLPPGEREGIIVTSQSPAGLLAQIRKRLGRNIWLMGGGLIAREFLKADLVDELYLGLVPVLLGEGIPLFPSGFPQRDFKLIENQSYSKGLVSLKYARARKRASREG